MNPSGDCFEEERGVPGEVRVAAMTFFKALCEELEFRALNAKSKEAREALQSAKHAIEDVIRLHTKPAQRARGARGEPPAPHLTKEGDMAITFGDRLIDSGHYDISPEQEREIEAREECDRRGIDPDAECADGGVLAWMVVDQELRQRPRPASDQGG